MNAALLKEIQCICREKGWTKTDLAKGSGIHISEISRIFNHKRSLTLKYLDAISEAIGLERVLFILIFMKNVLMRKK